MSADPTWPNGSSIPLNRLAYANDNPLRFLDPSGLDAQQDLANCAANVVACLEWSYGDSPVGIVFVMGLSESRTSPDDLDHYRGYAEEFLDRYDPGCENRGAECWSAAEYLETHYGSDTAYQVFGIKFIESDPHGHVVGGLVGAIPGIRKIPFVGKHLPDRGLGELGRILANPQGKFIVGAIGVSLGAGTVAKYFSEHRDIHVPFVLDSFTELDPGIIDATVFDDVIGLPNFVASTTFFSCDCGPLSHGANDELASTFYDDFDWYNALLR